VASRFSSPHSPSLSTSRRAFRATDFRNLRFALPAALRSQLPLGSLVWVAFAVTAKADNANGCATSGA
jgi:hypothetical protein